MHRKHDFEKTLDLNHSLKLKYNDTKFCFSSVTFGNEKKLESSIIQSTNSDIMFVEVYLVNQFR